MKSIFIGTRIEAFKVVSLKTKIEFVITKKKSFIDKYVDKRKYKIFYVDKKNLSNSLNLIKNSNARLIFSSGFPYLIPKIYLIKKKLFINSHPSLLPKYKGYRPVVEALKKKEKILGVSVHFINDNLDSGKIIYKKKLVLNKLTKINNIYKILFAITEPQAINYALDKILKK